jgi:hypothetical protein
LHIDEGKTKSKKESKKVNKTFKIFSEQNFLDNNNLKNIQPQLNNIYKNYYPQQIKEEFFKKEKNEKINKDLDKSLDNLKQCRQLKFLEKRKLLTREKLNRQFQEYKTQYEKLFGTADLSKPTVNNQFVILNNKRKLNKEEINNFLGKISNDNEMECEIYEINKADVNKDTRPDDLLSLIKQEQNQLLTESEDKSDEELDIDSNCENNPNNEYPDEESYSEEDEYELYNSSDQTNTYKSQLKRAEQRMNKASKDLDEDY